MENDLKISQLEKQGYLGLEDLSQVSHKGSSSASLFHLTRLHSHKEKLQQRFAEKQKQFYQKELNEEGMRSLIEKILSEENESVEDTYQEEVLALPPIPKDLVLPKDPVLRANAVH